MSTVVMHNVVSVDGFIATRMIRSALCSTGTATATPSSSKVAR